jgi:sigma-B regulation protein RsbU (phosphoserine phosphatase)
MDDTTQGPDASREERRQRAVESLGVLDGGPNERLDRITRLARTIFGVPLSSVTILDGDRAFFPSAQGFESREAPREDTFCDHTTSAAAPVIVEDAVLDSRFRDLAPVTRDHIRFYAGEPLRDPVGNVLGTFCLFDTEPRSLSDDEVITFRDLAKWAEQELLSSTEMTQAGLVQASMLPSQGITTGPWEIDGICLPALAVGGDFYDFGVDNDVLHLGLGDVMGKGTGAALVGAGVRAALRGTHSAVTAGVDLGVVATQVARSLMPDLERTESFVTLFEAAVDLDDGTLRYIDAGMGLCLVVRQDGRVDQLRGPDRPFGILPDDHWTEKHTVLDPGDRMLLFSDGLLDLLDDPDAWIEPVAAMVSRLDTTADLLSGISSLAGQRTALDDVTAVAVFRRPVGTSGT